jgi:hypothetical protein
MTAVPQAVGDTAPGTLLYTDPFEHRAAAPGGLSALGLAEEAAERGAAVVYWYGYNRADQRRWIFDLLRVSSSTIDWSCGDLMASAPQPRFA